MCVPCCPEPQPIRVCNDDLILTVWAIRTCKYDLTVDAEKSCHTVPVSYRQQEFYRWVKCFINAIEYLVATLYNRVAWILNPMSVDLNGITLVGTMIYIRFDWCHCRSLGIRQSKYTWYGFDIGIGIFAFRWFRLLRLCNVVRQVSHYASRFELYGVTCLWSMINTNSIDTFLRMTPQ